MESNRIMKYALYTTFSCSCFVDDHRNNTDTNDDAEDNRKPLSTTLNERGNRWTYQLPALCVFQSTTNAEDVDEYDVFFDRTSCQRRGRKPKKTHSNFRKECRTWVGVYSLSMTLEVPKKLPSTLKSYFFGGSLSLSRCLCGSHSMFRYSSLLHHMQQHKTCRHTVGGCDVTGSFETRNVREHIHKAIYY